MKTLNLRDPYNLKTVVDPSTYAGKYSACTFDEKGRLIQAKDYDNGVLIGIIKWYWTNTIKDLDTSYEGKQPEMQMIFSFIQNMGFQSRNSFLPARILRSIFRPDFEIKVESYDAHGNLKDRYINVYNKRGVLMGTKSYDGNGNYRGYSPI